MTKRKPNDYTKLMDSAHMRTLFFWHDDDTSSYLIRGDGRAIAHCSQAKDGTWSAVFVENMHALGGRPTRQYAKDLVQAVFFGVMSALSLPQALGTENRDAFRVSQMMPLTDKWGDRRREKDAESETLIEDSDGWTTQIRDTGEISDNVRVQMANYFSTMETGSVLLSLKGAEKLRDWLNERFPVSQTTEKERG